MSLFGINGVAQNSVGDIWRASAWQMSEQKGAQSEAPILQLKNSANDIKDNISDAKVITENFKNEIMKKLNPSKLSVSPEEAKYYLNELIETLQVLNGVQKNNLKPQGNEEQNKVFYQRIKESESLMEDYLKFVGSSELNVAKNPKTGVYELYINNKSFAVPARKVEIVKVSVEDPFGYRKYELMPEIID